MSNPVDELLLLPTYRQIAEEYVQRTVKCSLSELTVQVKAHFDLGAVRSFTQCIGDRLTGLSISQRTIADGVGVEESTVSKWINEGRMSFWNWVKLLLAFNLRINDFGFPEPDQAIFRAYAAAAVWVGKILDPTRTRPELQRNDYELLRQWMQNGTWLAAAVTNDEVHRQRLRATAAKEISTNARHAYPKCRHFTAKDISATAVAWGDIWCVTVLTIPYRWPVTDG